MGEIFLVGGQPVAFCCCGAAAACLVVVVVDSKVKLSASSVSMVAVFCNPARARFERWDMDDRKRIPCRGRGIEE